MRYKLWTDAVDHSGKIINDCTVLHPTRKRQNTYIVWKVLCNLCGEEFDRPSNAIARGSVSHMCSEWIELYHPRKGRPPLPDKQSHVNNAYCHIKRTARSRSLDFKLTKDVFRRLSEQPCRYCGAPPAIKFKYQQLSGEWKSNGIDRIDNSKGYEIKNCVPCCKTCNVAKSTMSVHQFRQWIKRVHSHFIASH